MSARKVALKKLRDRYRAEILECVNQVNHKLKSPNKSTKSAPDYDHCLPKKLSEIAKTISATKVLSNTVHLATQDQLYVKRVGPGRQEQSTSSCQPLSDITSSAPRPEPPPPADYRNPPSKGSSDSRAVAKALFCSSNTYGDSSSENLLEVAAHMRGRTTAEQSAFLAGSERDRAELARAGPVVQVPFEEMSENLTNTSSLSISEPTPVPLPLPPLSGKCIDDEETPISQHPAPVPIEACSTVEPPAVYRSMPRRDLLAQANETQLAAPDLAQVRPIDSPVHDPNVMKAHCNPSSVPSAARVPRLPDLSQLLGVEKTSTQLPQNITKASRCLPHSGPERAASVQAPVVPGIPLFCADGVPYTKAAMGVPYGMPWSPPEAKACRATQTDLQSNPRPPAASLPITQDGRPILHPYGNRVLLPAPPHRVVVQPQVVTAPRITAPTERWPFVAQYRPGVASVPLSQISPPPYISTAAVRKVPPLIAPTYKEPTAYYRATAQHPAQIAPQGFLGPLSRVTSMRKNPLVGEDVHKLISSRVYALPAEARAIHSRGQSLMLPIACKR